MYEVSLAICPMHPTLYTKVFYEIRNSCREFLHDNREFSLEETAEFLKENYKKYFVCQDAYTEDFIGYFRTSDWNLFTHQPTMSIGMDMHEVYRGLGYAKPLYYMFFIFLRDNFKIHTVYLEVLESNKVAFQLYQDLGFQIQDEREVPGRGRSFKMYRSL